MSHASSHQESVFAIRAGKENNALKSAPKASMDWLASKNANVKMAESAGQPMVLASALLVSE